MELPDSSGAANSRAQEGASLRRFVQHAILWNIGLFALIRLPWVTDSLVAALIRFQTSLIFWYGAKPNPGIVVDASCSGADVAALCLGVTLAYPVAWRQRLIGAAIGVAGIIALNSVRIATLLAIATSPDTLNLLHVYVWPAVLTLITVAYVWLWIRWTERPVAAMSAGWRRFFVLSLAGLVVYAVSVPWMFSSAALGTAGIWTASAGATALASLGASVTTSGSTLFTSRGAFQVTQECLFTPMVPLYLAALFSIPLTRAKQAWGLALAVPLFFLLGVARLLVLALPPFLVDRPTILAHGFYQLLAGLVVIVGAAHLAERRATAWAASARAALALAMAIATGIVASRLWVPVMTSTASAIHVVSPAHLEGLSGAADQQGALALLPVFQIGLLCGVWFALTGGRRRRALAWGLALVAVSQLCLLVGLGMFESEDMRVHALLLRAWAIGVPVAVAAVWAAGQGTIAGDPSYRRFWNDVGDRFPVLTGAASTSYYSDNERRLITETLPPLAGLTILKTDLWDEAKNTRIMQWAADQGARVVGIDIAEPIVRQAREAFGARPLRPAVGDVRRLPFPDDTFDAIYSMGTVEHFVETEASVAELARVLRPGGRLILGVPNRHDPFLRPMMVAALYAVGLYGYGFEKSYSRRGLRRLVEQAGLRVRTETGILFMPGWLRMIDLWCYTRARPLAAITGALVRPFAWADRHVPMARRHGYLIATAAEKPAAPTAPAAMVPSATHAGTEYVIDAHRCDPAQLRSLPRLQRLFADVLRECSLYSVAPPTWHVFPGHGGITGMVLLSESHLTIHTYPEASLAAINLYCCRPSVEWNWEVRLREALGARAVTVRELRRGT